MRCEDRREGRKSTGKAGRLEKAHISKELKGQCAQSKEWNGVYGAAESPPGTSAGSRS